MSIAIHVDQQRDESLLGASECAGVLGLDKYSPPIKIWRRHRGLVARELADNEPAYWGTVLEPVVRGHYAVQSDRLVIVPTESTSRDGWLRCTPDGFSTPVPNGFTAGVESMGREGGRTWPRMIDQLLARHPTAAGLVQVKTCSEYLRDDWKGGPPAKYEVQVRVEMAVTGLPWADIVCLCGGQHYLGPFRIERDLSIEERLLDPLRQFWDMVQSGVEPTVDHTEQWRRHVSEKMERALPTMVTADEAFTASIEGWREARRTRKASERTEGRIRNEILLRLSAAGATRVDAGELGRITAYKTKGTWAVKSPTAWKED